MVILKDDAKIATAHSTNNVQRKASLPHSKQQDLQNYRQLYEPSI